MQTTAKPLVRGGWFREISRAAFYGLVAFGCWLLIEASLYYVEMGRAHPFFLEKLPLRFEHAFAIALYTHIPASLFALPACLVLLLKTTQKKFPRFHRWLGRMTGAVVVFAVVPSGIWLAFSAKGGMLSTVGFLLTAAITLVAMVKSILAARSGDLKSHRRFSVHVAAQLSVAITSRMLLVLADMASVDETTAYIAALYVPIACSVWLAERVTRPRRPWRTTRFPLPKGAPHETRGVVCQLDPVR